MSVSRSGDGAVTDTMAMGGAGGVIAGPGAAADTGAAEGAADGATASMGGDGLPD
ncbi:MAG: hypothetical protein AAF677_11940 [Pseudomonadota bacterium]